MANVQFSGLLDSNSSDGLWSPRSGAALVKSATEYVYQSGSLFIKVEGANLTYSGDDPAGGTYTSITIASDGGFLNTVAQFISVALDFSIYFADYTNWQTGGATGGPFSALSGNDVLIDLSLNTTDVHDLIGHGGADFLVGGEGPDSYWYFFASDLVAGEQILDTGTSGQDAIIIHGTSGDRGGGFVRADLTIDLRLLLFNGIEGLELYNDETFVKCIINSNQLDGLKALGDGFTPYLKLNSGGPSELYVRMNLDNFSAARLKVSDASNDDKIVIQGNSGFNVITGSSVNDTIFGDSGNDILKGGAGKDALIGGSGKDMLRGGTGRDSFDFNSVKESVTGSNRDKILDFKHGQHDKIDLQSEVQVHRRTGFSRRKGLASLHRQGVDGHRAR